MEQAATDLYLPQVPRSGRATEALPRVLLTKRPETQRRKPPRQDPKQKQHLVSPPSRGKWIPGHPKLGGSATCKSNSIPQVVQSFRDLIQKDHATKPQFAKTLLAPGGDTGQHDVGLALKSMEESCSLKDDAEKDILASLANSFWDEHASSFALDPLDGVSLFRTSRDASELAQDALARASAHLGSPSPGRSLAEQQAYCRSLMRSRNESRLTSPASCSVGGSGASERDAIDMLDAETRLRHLKRSFAVSADEVAARLEDLRRRPVWDAYAELTREVEESSSSRPQSSMTNQSWTEVPAKPRRSRRKRTDSDTSSHQTQDLCLSHVEMPTTAEEVRFLCLGASLNMMPYKRLQPLARLEDDVFDNVPNDSYDEVSQREELLRAVKKLNTYRWFCRLPPVLVDEDSTELCEFLNESMVSRKPVFVKESHSLTRRVSDLGDQLGGFMANSGHAMILHKAGSLISAIDVGILCSHTGGWSYSSAPAPGAASEAAAAGQSAQDEILSRGQLHSRGNTARERPKPGLAAWCLQAATEVQPVSVQNLPDSLAGYRTMWEILDKLGGGIKQDGCNAPSRASKGKSLHMEATSPSPTCSRLGSAAGPTRPGTGVSSLPSGRSTPFQDRRPGTGSSTPGRLRTVFWGSNETARRREWSRASNLSWGDRTNTVTLRRQLLSPRLQNFGASRLRETCVIRTGPGTGETAEDEEEWAKRDETDFVVFPPYGVCPLELLGGHALPTWTIMPNSHRFQPTHALQVRMWRVKLLRGEEDIGGEEFSHGRTKSASKSLDGETPCDAHRLEELHLSSVTCDCSSRGNAFCIIFRPQLIRICEGDQFEVEVSGLLGSSERQYFFHDFKSGIDLEWKDQRFLEAVNSFCSMTGGDTSNYAEPSMKITLPKSITKSLAKSLSGRFASPTSSLLPEDRRRNTTTTWHDLPAMGLVSHTSKEIRTDESQLDIFLHCAGVVCFEARLHMQRSDGNALVQRATRVFQMKDFFLVRLKLPCAVSKYELSFHMATVPRAKELAEHPFKYTIKTSESAQCPLSSLEHAAYLRFGLSPMPAVAQPFGITICSPIDYAVPPVSMYFLVHLHPDCVHSEAVREPTGETPSSLLFRRLRADDEAADQEALLNETIQSSDPFFANGMLDRSACLTQLLQRRNFQDTQRMLLHRPSAVTMDPTVNVLRRLHHGLEWHLGERTQDVPGAARFDVVVSEGKTQQQRFAYSLQPNLGFPEFFDGVLHLNENDAGSRIELFFSLTVEEEADKAPMKIGEWKVARSHDALA